MSPTRMSEENDFQSNRPYTLFYYPSYRLPPLLMSEDELRQLWCLLDSTNPKEKPFSVDARLSWNMDQLTEAIQDKQGALRDFYTSDIVLWKVNEHIPVSPIDSFHQRLPISLSDSCSALNDPAWKVSECFPEDLAKDTLRIVVSQPDTKRAYKKRRVGPAPLGDQSEGAFDGEWDHLWHTFWGNPATHCFSKTSAPIPDPRTLETPPEETNYEYLKLPNDDDFFPCNLHRILITETYTSLYKVLCEQDRLYTELPKQQRLISLKHSTIIAGQPGTGKTVGLSCILVWRLQEKKPTVYCSNKEHAYVFTSTGVQLVSLRHGKRIEVLDKSIHCCALVDVNPELLEVPSQFQPSLRRQGRVVVATSPNPDHVTAFKQDHAMTYYTPTWKWADIYCASLVQFLDVDPEILRNTYTKLAGIPRRCFRALTDKGDVHEMEIIKSAIDNIENIEDFAKSTSGPMPFKIKESHALVRMEPTDDKWDKQTTNLLSDYVADLVFDRIDLHNTLKIRDSIDSLLRNPNARSWAGKLFERAVHRAFRKGFEFEPEAMDDNAPSLLVQIKKAESEAGGYFHTLAVRAGKRSQRVGEEFLNQYLIPLSSTAETIDGVDILENVTILFQMTVSPTHSLNLKGITELTNELPAYAKRRICIVFVVPEHETTREPYTRQNIVIPGGVPKHVSDPVVAYNQYVYYFPMDKL